MNEKKYNKDEALAKIKAKISNFYESMGREEKLFELNDERKELIDEIDEILNQTSVSKKHLIIERLNLDNEIKEELKGKWK